MVNTIPFRSFPHCHPLFWTNRYSVIPKVHSLRAFDSLLHHFVKPRTRFGVQLFPVQNSFPRPLVGDIVSVDHIIHGLAKLEKTAT